MDLNNVQITLVSESVTRQVHWRYGVANIIYYQLIINNIFMVGYIVNIYHLL